jgi:uncharacterized protein YjiS (DUF1127 family)
MSATLSAAVRSGATDRASAVSGFVVACWDALSGYFVRRTAITTLRELDDRALRDIRIARSQIEAAVHGLISLPDRARMS